MYESGILNPVENEPKVIFTRRLQFVAVNQNIGI